jgi:hypothetical protein
VTHSSVLTATHSKKRSQSPLSAGLEKSLSSYALAAGSAGVALLACVQAADAKVVITKVDITVPLNAGPINFDINGDGQNDFGLSAFGATVSTCTFTQDARVKHRKGGRPLGCGGFDSQLRVVPAQAANEVWQAGTSYGDKCAANLGRGVRIDRLRAFAPGIMVMYGDEGSSEGNQFCPWGRVNTKQYLGVKFLDKGGNVHYGWVRVTVNFVRATITGYAYETIPNKPILAGAITEDDETSLLSPSDVISQPPQPATLGHLALGAVGLTAWRREEKSFATSRVA